jgi:hypothetical protein
MTDDNLQSRVHTHLSNLFWRGNFSPTQQCLSAANGSPRSMSGKPLRVARPPGLSRGIAAKTDVTRSCGKSFTTWGCIAAAILTFQAVLILN